MTLFVLTTTSKQVRAQELNLCISHNIYFLYIYIGGHQPQNYKDCPGFESDCTKICMRLLFGHGSAAEGIGLSVTFWKADNHKR